MERLAGAERLAGELWGAPWCGFSVQGSSHGNEAIALTVGRPGDKVILVVQWRSETRDRPFTVQSAIPRSLAFQRAGHDAAEVSIDGGRNWGELGALRIGSRLASAEDVTHVRMRVAGSPTGRLTYSAIVR